MKILKRISALFVVAGILLVVAGPIWSRFQTSRLRSMQDQMKEMVGNPQNISADSPDQKQFAKDVATQMGKIGDAVKHSMRLVYFGVLCTLIGFGGVTFCLNQEIKTGGVPNKTPEHISQGRGRPSENAQR